MKTNLITAWILAALLPLGACAQTQPTITQQPTNVSVPLGGVATFTVRAEGSAPLVYVWEFNGHSESNLLVTVAGGGATNADGLAATRVNLTTSYGIAADGGGNFYIAEGGRLRVRKVATNGIITTVAGTGAVGFSGDGGCATNATLNGLLGVAVGPQGTVFIADSLNHRIRAADAKGIITTVAGTGPTGTQHGSFSGDGGPATNAGLNQPSGIAFDAAGNMLIADQYNHRIRKVTADGVIQTVAGGGGRGRAGDGGYATNAQLNAPFNLCVDAAGNLFIADYFNNRIRKVDTSGIITSVSTNTGPNAVAVDGAGNLFVAAADANSVDCTAPGGAPFRMAGTGLQGHTVGINPPDGCARLVNLNFPSGLAWLPGGELLIADSLNGRVRKMARVGATLRLPVNYKPGPGPVQVVVSNPYGSVTSDVASVTIAPTPPAVTSTDNTNYTLVLLQYTVAAGSNYVLQATPDLTPPVSWAPVVTNVSGGETNDNWSYVVTNWFDYPHRYYQLVPAP